jgi:DNA adenine methylase
VTIKFQDKSKNFMTLIGQEYITSKRTGKASLGLAKIKRHVLPFRYPGGKHYAMDILQPFFMSVEHKEYREPFAGGATVFFNKEKCSYNWLNDKDEELITTFKAMQREPSRKLLLERVSQEEASKKRWREVFEYLPDNKDDIAFKYFYLNRTSFSGKLVSPSWGYRPQRSLPPERWHERIIPCGEKLKGVKLTSVDFQEVIKAKSENGGPVLMYIDPPYYKPPHKKHYRYDLSIDDHVRLASLLKKTRHKFFLTYDDCPEIRELYDWANIFELKFFYRVQDSNTSNGSRKYGFELVITNYNSEYFNLEVLK